MRITLLPAYENHLWNQYVYRNKYSTVYHRAEWRNIIKDSYGHQSIYIVAKEAKEGGKEVICGILPLILIDSSLFGTGLYSMPFCDLGGMIADNLSCEIALMNAAIHIANRRRIDTIELRQSIENGFGFEELKKHSAYKMDISVKDDKVRMLLELPESAEVLLKSFKSKLRNQIKKPIKYGLKAKVGGKEMIDDFYKVFATNMRDLGSPVHSKRMISNTMKKFADTAQIVTVYLRTQPVATGLIIGYKNMMFNPWSSALHQYSRLSGNMLLYWTMLTYACEKGYRIFDFGRSTRGEGTYKFKEQWGAKEERINWIVINTGDRSKKTGSPEKHKYRKFIKIWKKMPIRISMLVGPMLRKNIGL